MVVKNVTNPIIVPFESVTRQPGISGFMRIRNEAQFIEQTIRSWLPYVDELVIVYHDCQDGTDIIIKYIEREYPTKIKIFHYIPKVYSFGTLEFINGSLQSPNHFCYYSNFALSQTTHEILVKIDGDHIAIPSRLEAITKELQTNGLPYNYLWTFSGVNLWKIQNQYYIKDGYLSAGDGDCFYFIANPMTYFVKHPHRKDRELLKVRFQYYYYLGMIFWHTHCMKEKFLQTLPPIQKIDKFSNHMLVINNQFKMYPLRKQFLELLDQETKQVLLRTNQSSQTIRKQLQSNFHPHLWKPSALLVSEISSLSI